VEIHSVAVLAANTLRLAISSLPDELYPVAHLSGHCKRKRQLDTQYEELARQLQRKSTPMN
jgi:hypothetical protein